MLQSCCTEPKSPEALRVYADMLKDIPPDALLLAVERYLNEDRQPFYPGPGQLRALAAELVGGEIPAWEDAWARIMEALQMWDLSDREKAIAARQHVGEALYDVMKKIIAPATPFYDLMAASSAQLEVMKSNFRSAFTSQRNRMERNRALPEALRPAVANLGGPVKKHLEQFGSMNREDRTP